MSSPDVVRDVVSGVPTQDSESVELTLTTLQDRRQESPLPTPIRNPKLLPLAELEPEVFERLIAELVVNVTNSPTVHFYGRRGQRQHGIDIFEEQAAGARTLYQVKRYATVSAAQVRQAVEDYAGLPRSPGQRLPPRRFDPTRFVLVTSAAVDDDTAKVDAVETLQREYRGDLAISVWGAEMVSRLLRNLPLLVWSVFGDPWTLEYCGQESLKRARKEADRRRRIDEALSKAASTQYSRDNEIRFRQVELSGPSVDSLFVDVPASTQPGTPTDEFLARINPSGRSDRGGAADEVAGAASARAGAAQALLHPDWSSSAVVVGGPGQGKTTLLQFICQFHRARAQGREEYSPIAAGLRPVSDIVRTSLRLELPLFAEWRRARFTEQSQSPAAGSGQRKGTGKAQPDQLILEDYIADLVQQMSGRSFTTTDLYTAVRTRPMLSSWTDWTRSPTPTSGKRWPTRSGIRTAGSGPTRRACCSW